MRRLKVTFLVGVPLILLAGCTALFDLNVFSSLDKPTAPTLSDIKAPGGLATLAADLSSPGVVAALAADPTTVQEIKDYLAADYKATTGPLDSPDRQNAAALYADLSIKTTSGDELVNNVVTALSSSPADLSTLLKSVVPPDVAADPKKFSAMIKGFLDAEQAYTALGTSLATDSVLGTMNLGDVAQKAAVSYLIETAYATATTYDAADPMTALYDLVSGAPSPIPSTAAFTDPFTTTPGWLQTIFDDSGAALPAL